MNKRDARLLLQSNYAWSLGEGMLGPLFAVFTQRIGGDIFDISWAWAVYLMLTGVLIMIVGKFSDQFIDKKKLMVIGYALNAVFTFSYLLVSSPVHLLLVQIGLSVAAAFSYPTWEALFARSNKKSEDGYGWGLADGGGRFFMGVAILIGGAIVTYGSFHLLFVVMGCLQVIATLRVAQILKK